ncbi:plasmid partitioning protein RepB C-terminal domain-containing protein [Brevundimonas nasdae]|uniref:ParB N-terminal domain-containing protein n=1 Tax=Brevundimonas nasdae TaxID=172043 RepID=A0ABX8TL25_9CAUL|nr:plasmid partitioning protein RepB C-terminal domain-containing protein [Brevundimonas nasdae]QYC11493.1 ParB N-terminal domain-containing protein [Brevundimonas nasdae]QYC14281.1 ParB N-terminal domain-containing protein [Brevundimonas nasdae]
MTDLISDVRSIPVAEITVLNPRSRNKKVFQELVASIANLGLKRPITVSARADGGYDLICGQGRLEAFMALGQSEIPALVTEASEEDCFVMSLVENLARRQHRPVELVKEIGALKARGYSTQEIAIKTDFSAEYIWAICFLLDNGEERLIAAVERGVIPHSVAMEIAKADDREVQGALADAYERKALPGNQVLAIRRIIEQRRTSGKAGRSGAREGGGGPRTRVTADVLVRAYRKETDRQKLLVKKAALTQSRLVFVVNALRRLLDDDHFVTLLRAESMHTLPRPLAERLGASGR